MSENIISKYLTTAPAVASMEAIEELEYEVYVKLTDFDQLKKAKRTEHQEQWVIKLNKGEALGVKVRTRKVVAESQVKYYLTTKLDLEGSQASWELEEEATRLHHDEIMNLADTGMIKERYFFPIDGTDMVWEVDVFRDAHGDMVPWVKIDLEVDKLLPELPPLPLDYSEGVFSQKGERTEEEDNLIHELYTKHFIIFKDDDPSSIEA